MAVLSFLFPLVGWILWAVKKDSNPEEASKCAKWAWIGFALSIVLGVIVGCNSTRYLY